MMQHIQQISRTLPMKSFRFGHAVVLAMSLIVEHYDESAAPLKMLIKLPQWHNGTCVCFSLGRLYHKFLSKQLANNNYLYF